MACAHTTLFALCELLDAQGILVQGPAQQGAAASMDASVSGSAGTADAPITGAACDSRCVRAGDVFFCKGAEFRPAFLESAAAAGAVGYICEPERAAELAAAAPQLPAIVTSDMRRAMALVSAEAWGRPDRALPQVGITGTKGKSTSAYMLRSIIDAASATRETESAPEQNPTPALPRNLRTGLPKSCGIIGSIDTYDGVEDIESTNTTPEAPDLWRHLANARDAGLAAMAMEVSSQALKYDRTLGVELDVAAFLNIGTDHISPVEHHNFEDYFASKLRIFAQCKTAVVNLGTTHVDRVLAAARQTNFAGTTPELVCVSAAGPEAIECGSCDMVFPDIWATDVVSDGPSVSFVAHGTTAEGKPGALAESEAWELPVKINFPGLFNVENALVAIAAAEMLDIERAHIAAGLAACRVPGRMELVGKPGSRVLCVVDYAHNSLSYQKFFASMAKEFGGRRIVALIGAPGGKAYERRVELPREAAKWASHIVVTEEDPAHDANEDICREMDANVPEGATLADGTAVTHEYVLDRQEAIARCLDVALGYGEPALVCLLGKGDETLIHRGNRFEPMVPDAEAYRAAAEARGLEL